MIQPTDVEFLIHLADYPDFESGPVAPPGLEDLAPTWIGWGYWITAIVAFFGFVAAAVMMMVGRMASRGAVAADGLRAAAGVVGGLCIIVMAGSIITGLLAT
ncbi:hypothetical protein ACFXKD_00025 [Nocardiopsis aegyptia]|uniref:hypothetical protein n=1 Tax=Nocardiopsis aegyptia TaxID=220378 RepID=UPI00366BF4E1